MVAEDEKRRDEKRRGEKVRDEGRRDGSKNRLLWDIMSMVFTALVLMSERSQFISWLS